MGPDDSYLFNDHLSRHRGIMGLLRRGEPVVPGISAGKYANANQQIGSGEKNESVAFLAPCATLIGNVQLAPNTSIFYKAMLKADVAAHAMNSIHSAEAEERWKSLPVGGQARKNDAGMFDVGSGINHPSYGGSKGGGIYIGEGTNIQDNCVVTSYEDHSSIGSYVTVGHSAHIHSATVGDESLIGMGAILKPGSVVESQSFVAAGAVIERGAVVKAGEIWGGNPARKLRDLTAEERGRLRTQAEKYIDVAQTHNHVMDMGGNVPDSFIEHDLLGAGSDASDSNSKDPQTQVGEGLNGEAVLNVKDESVPSSSDLNQKQTESGKDDAAEELRVDTQQQRQ